MTAISAQMTVMFSACSHWWEVN